MQVSVLFQPRSRGLMPDTLSSSGSEVIAGPETGSAIVSIREGAKLAGISPATLRRAIQEGVVRGIAKGRRIRVERREILEFRGGKLLKRVLPSRIENARHAGEIARDTFKHFGEGLPLVDVVQAVAVDPEVVERLWQKWLSLQELQRRSVVVRCLHHGPDCDGGPRPDASLCIKHAERSRVLSDDQLALLAGRMDITTEDDRLVVKANGRVIVAASPERSRELTRQLNTPKMNGEDNRPQART